MRSAGPVIALILVAWLLLSRPAEKRGPELAEGRLGSYSFLPEVMQWAGHAQFAASATGIPAGLILSVIHVESSGDPGAIGADGEVGLMQVMESTARDAGFSGVTTEPRSNIFIGASVMERLKTRYGADTWREVLRGYNGGPDDMGGGNARADAYAELVLRIWDQAYRGRVSDAIGSTWGFNFFGL